jgi:hypothetical protein
LGTTSIFAQNIYFDPDDEANVVTEGGAFTKRIEYNFISNFSHNLTNKTPLQKLFFGDFNGQFEFIAEPSWEANSGSYGVRLFRDSVDKRYPAKDTLDITYMLEIKRVVNLPELLSQVREKKLSAGEIFQNYKVETKYIKIEADFAKKLYAKVVDAIDNFKGYGFWGGIITDGTEFTFRCVVEYELWELTIHEPAGYIRRLTNLFNQLIKDAEENILDESKYATLMDELK